MRILFFLPLFILVACEAPTTQRPTYTDAEFKAEQQAQADAVKAAQEAKGGFNDQKEYSSGQIEAMVKRLNPLAVRVEGASETLCKEMGGKQCNFEVVLDATQKGLNAHADGQRVVVYPAMVEYATNDNQLAFVIAHEFAHSIMGHVASQQENVALGGLLGAVAGELARGQGYDFGNLGNKLGAHAGLLRYSASFENEADYVGLYILARAGYKIEDAPGFWRAMSLNAPRAVYGTTTHPNNPSRTVAMEKTVAEINAKKAAGQKLVPTIAARK